MSDSRVFTGRRFSSKVCLNLCLLTVIYLIPLILYNNMLKFDDATPRRSIKDIKNARLEPTALSDHVKLVWGRLGMCYCERKKEPATAEVRAGTRSLAKRRFSTKPCATSRASQM